MYKTVTSIKNIFQKNIKFEVENKERTKKIKRLLNNFYMYLI
jgi:hypothetical protein